jgi:hypothetical protein
MLRTVHAGTENINANREGFRPSGTTATVTINSTTRAIHMHLATAVTATIDVTAAAPAQPDQR